MMDDGMMMMINPGDNMTGSVEDMGMEMEEEEEEPAAE